MMIIMVAEQGLANEHFSNTKIARLLPADVKQQFTVKYFLENRASLCE